MIDGEGAARGRRAVERGDWQTPPALARALVERLTPFVDGVATFVEPTCGVGNFLAAAGARHAAAVLAGWELDPEYSQRAAAVLGARGRISCANFFEVDWRDALASLPRPLVVLGNPPWVTSAAIGRLGGTNLPGKVNLKQAAGLDALTGASNFDLAESVILTLLHALEAEGATIALLCKTSVARRVLAYAATNALPFTGLAVWKIDAMESFGASVDACFLAFRAAGAEYSLPVYATLDAPAPSATWSVRRGALVADLDAWARTEALAGECTPEWRSGVKHDASAILELRRAGAGLVNGLDVPVDVEPERLHPLVKGNDLLRGDPVVVRRWLLVPQTRLGEDTSALERTAPRTWDYLVANGARLDARRSAIYRRQARFAIFGIGPYTFAPWKVALCGLAKELRPCLLGPLDGQSVVLDDTCYFLPFDDEGAAREAQALLASAFSQEFFRARIFWDAKRPITKAHLQTLSLARLRELVGAQTFVR
ncbi:SAM-dependent methyltransferase [Myxococcota bacterium]|nr:SAM-dependent methyltransferase [Myxococcota bacterium]